MAGQRPQFFGRSAKAIAVVGQHGMDGTRKRLDRAAQKRGAVHLAGVVKELDTSELRHAVDGQQHVELAAGRSRLTDVDVDVADGCVGKLPRFAPLPGSCLSTLGTRVELSALFGLNHEDCLP